MTETQILFGILALLCLSDSVVWIRSVSVLFYQGWAGAFSHRDSSPFGNVHGGLFPLNPLPWNSAYFAYWTPVSFSPTALCNFAVPCPGRATLHSASRDWLPYRDITSAAAREKDLLINGRRFARCGTPREAQRLARLITQLSTLGEDRRARAIHDHLAATLSPSEAGRRHALVQQVAAPVRILCSVFFMMLFGVTPLLVKMFDFNTLLWPLLGTVLILLGAITVTYYRADRALNPGRRLERIGNVVKMIFCPPAAIRSTDLLTLDALADFHPLVVATVLYGTKPTSFYGDVIRDCLHPLPVKNGAPAAIATVTWYASAHREAVLRFFKAEFPQAHALAMQAPKKEGAARGYCPRCLSQFTRTDGPCSDCAGIALVEIPPVETPP